MKTSLLRMFGLGPKADPKIVDALFEAIVAAARQPVFYRDHGVPDSPLGRFEMLALHVALVLRAGRTADEAQRAVLQALTEEFFKDVDHSLRELGIGDTGVPKRMKKLASMFYGRLDAYARALDEGDEEALAAALERNITPDGALSERAGLAAYVFKAAAGVAESLPAACAGGRLVFAEGTP